MFLYTDIGCRNQYKHCFIVVDRDIWQVCSAIVFVAFKFT